MECKIHDCPAWSSWSLKQEHCSNGVGAWTRMCVYAGNVTSECVGGFLRILNNSTTADDLFRTQLLRLVDTITFKLLTIT